MPLTVHLLIESITDWALRILLPLATVFLLVQMYRAFRFDPRKRPENGHDRADRKEYWYSIVSPRWNGKQKDGR
jgi:hypothetical protein